MLLTTEILKLNQAGQEAEFTAEQAEDLGAIEEDALTEVDAIESTQIDEE